GYTEEEVRGENPNILQSGEQDRTFYTNMWDMLRQEGIWQGEIINKKKNGELYRQWQNIREVRSKEGDIERYVGTFSEMDCDRGTEKRCRNVCSAFLMFSSSHILFRNSKQGGYCRNP